MAIGSLVSPNIDESKPIPREASGTLIRPAIQNMRHGAEISKDVWEPLLGGELNDIWKKVFSGTTSKVLIRGSTVSRTAFGGYVYDENTGMASSELRSDIDVILRDDTEVNEVMDRLRALEGIEIEQTSISHKVKYKGLEVGFVAESKLRDIYVDGIDALTDILKTATEIDYFKRSEFLDKLGSLRNRFRFGTPLELLQYEALFKHETLAIRFERGSEDGYKASLIDVANIFGDDKIERQINAQIEKFGDVRGIVFPGLNEESLPALLFDVLQHLKGKKIDSQILLWTINEVPRMIRASCDLNVELALDTEQTVNFYQLMYKTMQEIVDGTDVFGLEGAAYSKYSRGEDTPFTTVRSWLEQRVQEEFARGSFNNPESAFAWVFLQMPFSKFISPSSLAQFEEFGKDPTIPHRNDIIYLTYGFTPEMVSATCPKAVKDMLTYFALISERYGCTSRPMGEVKDSALRPTGVSYLEAETFPKGMSEIMSMMFVAFGWDGESNKRLIEEVVANWKPKGVLHGVWKTQAVDFELGVNLDSILDNMKFAKKLLNKRALRLAPVDQIV